MRVEIVARGRGGCGECVAAIEDGEGEVAELAVGEEDGGGEVGAVGGGSGGVAVEEEGCRGLEEVGED